MIMLTKDEKASRFDALQTAFGITKMLYTERMVSATAKYKDGSIISAYNKGLADAYEQMIEDIERWIV